MALKPMEGVRLRNGHYERQAKTSKEITGKGIYPVGFDNKSKINTLELRFLNHSSETVIKIDEKNKVQRVKGSFSFTPEDLGTISYNIEGSTYSFTDILHGNIPEKYKTGAFNIRIRTGDIVIKPSGSYSTKILLDNIDFNIFTNITTDNSFSAVNAHSTNNIFSPIVKARLNQSGNNCKFFINVEFLTNRPQYIGMKDITLKIYGLEIYPIYSL